MDVKIDFSDYPDSNGRKLGCSGNTAFLPICFRIWVQDQGITKTRLAGFFSSFPTTASSGTGQLAIFSTELGGVTIVQTYDYQNTQDQSSELFAHFHAESGESVSGHSFFTQKGPEDSALKTLIASTALRASDDLNDVPDGTLHFFNRFLEDQDFWNGTVDAQNVTSFGFEKSFSDVCALISTGNRADLAECLGAGLSIDDLTFLPFASAGDLSVPASLPANPTF